MSITQRTALLRAVEATGWRPALPADGPLLSIRVTNTASGEELNRFRQSIANQMARTLGEQLLEAGYLRLEVFPSQAEFGQYNLQLVFRPGLAEGGYQGPPPWPITPVGVRRKV